MASVSVIVPAYNASPYLAETLKSILNQTYPSIEVIVVDDGSTDDTARIVESFAPRCRYIWQKNSGSCAGPRNTGLREATGNFVTFFDADDVMEADKIERQVADLQHWPTAIMSVLNYRNFTATEHADDHFSSCVQLSELLKKKHQDALTLESGECRALLLHENFSIASSPLFKTELVRALGGFDESLKACEDFHLIYRMAMHGSVIVNRQIGFNRRLHDLNMSGDNERMLRNYVHCRTLLRQSETEPRLAAFLESRIRQANRSLQDCLIRKGKTSEVFGLYRKTFPPRTLKDLNMDVKNAIKLCLTSAGVISGKV